MTNQFRPIHTCSRLLVHCAPTVAGRFHKRHLATFLGNPEFKLFIQQLAEVGMSYRNLKVLEIKRLTLTSVL